MATTFANVYYQRAVATPKSCWICHRETTVVLSTSGNVDWIYTCASHLTDPGFASPLASETSTSAPALTPEEIKKVAEEWEERQRLKKEKEKEKAAKVKKDNEQSKEKEESSKADDKPKPKPSSTLTPPPAAPSHPRFALHRQVFAMRQAEHRKKRQAAQAKQLASKFPSISR